MLTSGNGQHRRPRMAPKFVVTVGAAGAGIAIPLLSSGSAHAASVSTWDKVANCESAGNWSANAGDGFYGGLGITLDVWQRYGGTAYAQSPDLASRQQQIAVAEKVLDAQGPEYWSGCASDAGLLSGGATPDVDPGTPAPGHATTLPGLLGGLLGSGPASSSGTPTASNSASPTPGSPSATGSPTPTSTPTDSPDPAASAPSGSPTAAAPSTGRHAKPPTATGAGHEGAGASGGGAHARPGGAADGSPAGAYTVRAGDNLYEIATEQALPGGWPALYDANESTVGSNPDLILPGERLRLG